jgi:branched-chain amino acid transport system permease protein
MSPSFRPTRSVLAFLIFLGTVIVLADQGMPGWSSDTMVTALLLAVAATSVVISFGNLGMLNLTVALFFGVGGYGVALSTSRLGVTPLVGIVLAEAMSFVGATVLGTILVRTSGFYFAVVTLGMTTAFAGLIVAFPHLTHGASGITSTGVLDIFGWRVASTTDWTILSAIVLTGAVSFASILNRGRSRRLMGLVRRDELAAAVLGVRVPLMKLQVFVASSLLATFAGALYLYWQGVFVPDSANVVRAVQLLGMAIVGGLGSAAGGAVGAVLLVWMQNLAGSSGQWTDVIFGAAYVLAILFAPNGTIGLLRRGFSALAPSRGPEFERTRAAARPSRTVAPPNEAVNGGIRLKVEDSAVALRVSDVVCRFGGVLALDSVSIEARRGRVTALVGSNGAGKTTLVNVITGVVPPESGRVIVDSQELHGEDFQSVAALGVARTFQVPRLVDGLTAVENVCLGRDCLVRNGRMRFWPDRRYELATMAMARAALDVAGLGYLADRLAGALSTGERKLVEIVRATASSPSILLLDEPATGLSGDEIDDLVAVLAALRESNAAILMVDHNLDFVADLADYVYLMDAGRVVHFGTPAAVQAATESVTVGSGLVIGDVVK